MHHPLEKWYCDICGKIVENVKDGYVIWKINDQLKHHNFKIIHVGKCDQKEYMASAALDDFLGEKGVQYLLSFLSMGLVDKKIGNSPIRKVDDIDELVDLFRRVQTPYYEEARQYFDKPEFREEYADSGKCAIYNPEELRSIINTYGNKG